MQLAVMATARWVLRIEKGVALARLAHSLPGIAFEGVMSHQTLPGKPDRETRIRDGVPFMRMCLDVKDAIEAAGIPVGVVSAGETFSYDIAARLPGITEVEGGTYMLMSHSFDYMSEFRIAAKVLATVISTPRPGIAIGDVGTRALGLRAWPRVEGREGLALPVPHKSRWACDAAYHGSHCFLDLCCVRERRIEGQVSPWPAPVPPKPERGDLGGNGDWIVTN